LLPWLSFIEKTRLTGIYSRRARRVWERHPKSLDNDEWGYDAKQKGWTSKAELIVLAVYMPPQAPGPGHPWRTTSNRSSSAILPTVKAPEDVVNILTLQVKIKRITIGLECVGNIDCVAFLVTH
jgi:hypothetical protein